MSGLNDRRLWSHQVRGVIDEWVARGQSFYWAMDPEELKYQILRRTLRDGGSITYREAVECLKMCETSKMIGNANRGHDWIKKRWRDLEEFDVARAKGR